MDRDQLRTAQVPLKDRYRDAPEAAVDTFLARAIGLKECVQRG